MRNALCWTIVLVLVLSICGCAAKENTVNVDKDNSRGFSWETLYLEFTKNKISANDKEGHAVTIGDLNPNPHLDHSGYYTFFDMNDDGIPELYIKTTAGLSTLTIREENIILLRQDPYTTLLNNGHLFYYRPGIPDHYQYTVPSITGETLFTLDFYYSPYEENDPALADNYFVDNKEVSKECYEQLHKKVDDIGDGNHQWTPLPTLG